MAKPAGESREKIGSREPKLSSSGLTGAKALSCCERRKNSFELEVRESLGEMLRALQSDPKKDSPGLALVPPGVVIPGIVESPSVQPRVVEVSPRTSPGQIASFGAILLFGGTLLLDSARRLGALEATSGALEILGAVGNRQKRKQDDCESCIRRYLWTQKKALVRISKTSKRQRTDDPKLKRKAGRPKGAKDKRKRKRRGKNPRSDQNLRRRPAAPPKEAPANPSRRGKSGARSSRRK